MVCKERAPPDTRQKTNFLVDSPTLSGLWWTFISKTQIQFPPSPHLEHLSVVVSALRTAEGDEVLVHRVAWGAGRLPHKLNVHLLLNEGARYQGDVLCWKGSRIWGYSVWGGREEGWVKTTSYASGHLS